ncbi:hypothetical protein RUESEDTHA_00188 [Ruegeria sp. THAF57]|uniref:hypothetical protein n=1 Tax=Ruegeria sp. THAF57 TaxID=2744555 RepID=UPI0015DEA7B7|nr:hypothetical protein [Ruegeria sp. THAF57]CAD0183324.1 hypothetical protein RUESEDTHA_00188 [Ruegeria sp. THAF57]
MITKSFPAVATLWVGRPLSWIEQLSLTSFLAVGHSVKLYTYSAISGVPDGVEVADASDIFAPDQEFLQDVGPSMVADIFRLHLMEKRDEIWIDADMVAVKPITLNENGFAVGYESPNHKICNAVLRTPADSGSLKLLLDFIAKPHHQPPWLRPALRAKLADFPEQQLLSGLYKVKRSSMGPMALSYALRQTDEISEVRRREAFFSVPWQYSDVLFNPYGGAEGWMSADTEAVHLWSHALSNFHKTRRPHPNSFVGRMQSKLGIDVSHLKRGQ